VSAQIPLQAEMALALVRGISTVRLADNQQCGSKAARIGELSSRGYSVPASLILPVAAYERVTAQPRLEVLVRQFALESAVATPIRLLTMEQEMATAFEESTLPREIDDEIQSWIAAHGEAFAVRSSACQEDLRGASFAGLYSSFLDIQPQHVPRAVLRCFGSLFTARAAFYRRRKQIAAMGKMAVIIQEMVRGQYGGVVLTRSPRNPQTLLIECSPSGSDAVVSGQTSPSRFSLNRQTLEPEEVWDRHGLPLACALAVAREALAVEAEFGESQDIEYSVLNQTVCILQARPANAENHSCHDC
jgi:phosphoenolpyruvate synthase/pyruvate phosphate dikinase